MNWLAMPGKLLKRLAQGVLFLLAGLTAQAFAAGWLLLTCWMAFRMPGGASGWQALAAWWGLLFMLPALALAAWSVRQRRKKHGARNGLA